MPQSPQSDRPKRFVSFFGTGSVKPMWDEIWGVGGDQLLTHMAQWFYLNMGNTLQLAILMQTIMINHWIWGYPIFRQTHISF